MNRGSPYHSHSDNKWAVIAEATRIQDIETREGTPEFSRYFAMKYPDAFTFFVIQELQMSDAETLKNLRRRHQGYIRNTNIDSWLNKDTFVSIIDRKNLNEEAKDHEKTLQKVVTAWYDENADCHRELMAILQPNESKDTSREPYKEPSPSLEQQIAISREELAQTVLRYISPEPKIKHMSKQISAIIAGTEKRNKLANWRNCVKPANDIGNGPRHKD